MRRLILHIGRHKTGTTAVQHFLGDNREALARAGFYVPNTGKPNAGHHGFSHPLRPAKLRETPCDNPAQLPVFKKLSRELAEVDPALTLVISSEAFQNCDPAVVRTAFADYDVTIAVYLRNQLEYLASAYVQRVHATDYAGSLQDYYKNFFLEAVDYFEFLESWRREFDGRMLVRRYAAADMVEDFQHHVLRLGEGQDGAFKVRDSVSNPSLNRTMAAFKRELNHRAPRDQPTIDQMYFELAALNEEFPDDSYSVPPQLCEDLIAQCLSSDAKAAQVFLGEPQLFDYRDYTSAEEPVLSDADFERVYTALKKRVAEREAEKAQKTTAASGG